MDASNEIVRLRGCLETLHGLDPSGQVDPKKTAEDVAHISLNEIDQSDLGLAISLLFHPETGVISFLHKLPDSKGVEDAKAVLLEFLAKFIEKNPKDTQDFMLDLKESCLKLFSREKSSKVKVAVFEPLILMLESNKTGFNAEKFQIAQLFKKFFEEFQYSESKLSASVKASILQLLSLIAQYYPDHVTEDAEQLIKIIVRVVDFELFKTKKKPELILAAGGLKGLNSCLFSFAGLADESSKFGVQIFNILSATLDPPDGLSRYDVPRAGLSILGNHASHFRNSLFRHHEKVYALLQRLMLHKNSDLRKAGLRGLESFLKQISIVLKDETRPMSDDEKTTFWFFMKEFSSTLNKSDSSLREISVAVRGYGYFAGPCKRMMKEEDVVIMFEEVLKKSSWIFSGSSINVEETLHHLSSFIQSFSYLANEFQVSKLDPLLQAVEQIFEIFFVNFPKIPLSHRKPIYISISGFMATLFKKGPSVLSAFITTLSYEGLVYTCSDAITTAAISDILVSNDELPEVPEHSWMEYINFWENLFNEANLRDQHIRMLSEEERDQFFTCLYDGLISSLLKFLDNLNLEVKETIVSSKGDAIELVAQGGTLGRAVQLDAEVPKDFQLFLNLVDFSLEFLSTGHHTKYFGRWVYVFGHRLVTLSTKNPLVSGFYKLFGLTLSLSEKLDYFADCDPATMQQRGFQTSLSISSVDLQQVHKGEMHEVHVAAFTLFKKFIDEVVSRMQQFKDDLLGSCLKLLLSVPKELVQVGKLTKPLQVALKLGLSFLPLSTMALDALEYWIKEIPNKVQPYYDEILPALNDYLMDTSDSKLRLEADSEQEALRAKIKGRTRSSKVTQNTTASGSGQNAVQTLRFRILKLLGSIAGNNVGILKTMELTKADGKGLAWDADDHIKFTLPLQDAKPVLALDSILPRVIELAENSVDRKTKVVACELLHSLYIFMLASGASSNQAPGKKGEFYTLYEHVFPVIMRLAIDVDQVTRQLFAPLAFQTIHWFTNNATAEAPESVLLLMTCLDGVVDPTNSPLRDFSAECVAEFLKWSIKQSKKKISEALSANSILKRLYALLSHPNAYKRLGAALTFNKLYRILREEDSLIDIFILEITFNALLALKLAALDDPELGTIQQSTELLGHMKKIIIKKSKLLLKASNDRKTVTTKSFRDDTEDFEIKTLGDLVAWLFDETGRKESDYSHQCMELFSEFVKLLADKSSATEWLKQRLAKEPKFVVHLYEPQNKLHTPADPGKGLGIGLNVFSSPLFAWFDQIGATLDGYTWLIGERLLDSGHLFEVSSEIFKVISEFNRFYATNENQPFLVNLSPSEHASYRKKKCTVIVKSLFFVFDLLERAQKGSTTIERLQKSGFWSADLFEVFSSTILAPSSIGFDMNDKEVNQKLPDLTSKLLVQLKTKLQPEGFSRMCQSFGSTLRRARMDFSSVSFGFNEFDVEFYTTLSRGYMQLSDIGILDPIFEEARIEKAAFCQNLFTKVSQIPDTSDPVLRKASRDLMEVAFIDKDVVSGLVDRLTDHSVVYLIQGDDKTIITNGQHFYEKFSEGINHYYTKHFKSFVATFLSKGTDAVISNVLLGVLDYLLSGGRKLQEKLDFLDSFTKSQELLVFMRDNFEDAYLLRVLRKSFLLDSKLLPRSSDDFKKLFCEIYLRFLSRPVSLSVKIDAMDVLHYFLLHPGDHISKIEKNLELMVANQFPLTSKDYPQGTVQYNEYTAALDKLVDALVLSGSVEVLRVLIGVICREDDHAHGDRITKGLEDFASKLPPQKCKEAADLCLGIFQDRKYQSEHRKRVIQQVLVPFLLKAEPAVVEQSLVRIAAFIMTTLSAPLLSEEVGEAEITDQLRAKISCFELVQVAYTKLSTAQVNTPGSVLNSAYYDSRFDWTAPKGGKELTQAIVKICIAIKSTNVSLLLPKTAPNLKLIQEYYCASHSALCAVVMNTQTQEKFYHGFLFKPGKKEEVLWENIVDTTTKYTFEIELDHQFVKKKMAGIRPDAGSSESSRSTGLKYLSFQYLADSSLSQSLKLFGHRGSLRQSGSAGEDPGKVAEAPVASTAALAQEKDLLELEMDVLNQNPTMPAFLKLLLHLHTVVSPPKAGEKMPSWMQELYDKILSQDTHINVRLFIAKLVINRPQVFEPYGELWWKPLALLVVDSPLYGGGINYFVQDICVLLLAWAGKPKDEPSQADKTNWPPVIPNRAKEDEVQISSRLLAFLMANTFHPTNFVMRTNLELIKGFLENWGSQINIPTAVICDQFSRTTNKEEKENLVGVQLLGVVLANNLPPFDSATSGQYREADFYRRLVENLSFKYQEVYSSTAEVCGMILRYLDPKDDKASQMNSQANVKTFEEFLSLLSKRVEKLFPAQNVTAESDRFLRCLHKISMSYPPFSDQFMKQVLFHMPRYQGEFKTFGLEIILTRAQTIPDLFVTLQSQDLLGLLKHRDDAVQLIVLMTLFKILKDLKTTQVAYFLDSMMTSFTNHPNLKCRIAYFDVLIWLFDNMKISENDPMSRALRRELLKGLTDESQFIRGKLGNFWNNETRLPVSTFDRLEKVLSHMYVPEIEETFLNFATAIILEAAQKSPDFQRKIFERTENAKGVKFDPQFIHVEWKQRAAPMAPLFSPISSQGDVGQSQDVNFEGQVKATPNMANFTLTQTTESRDHPVSTLSLFDFAQPSSLMFSRGLDSQGGSKGSVSKTAATSKYSHLHRRFSKANVDEALLQQLKRVERTKRRLDITQKVREQARVNKVNMYRVYRIGELPDIEIKNEELIAPLQALAQKDTDIARQLFSILFLAIVDTLRDRRSLVADPDRVRAALSQKVQSMLESSQRFFSPFIGSLLRIAFGSKTTGADNHIVVPPKILGKVSYESSNFHMGIMLLEKQITERGTVAPPPAKRARTNVAVSNTTNATMEDWTELASLYRAIQETDFFQNIFERKISKSPITNKGIHAELMGDYRLAYEIYHQAINDASFSKSTDEDVEIWEQQAMESIEKLTMWDELATNTIEFVENIEHLWQEKRRSELGYFVRSHIKLLDGISRPDNHQKMAVHPWTLDEPNPLFNFLEGALQDKHKALVLESNFCAELATASIIKNDFNKARYYVQRSWDLFVNKWSNLHPLVDSVRRNMLKNLQRLVEMDEFLQVLRQIQPATQIDLVNGLSALWKSRYPSKNSDSSIVWDDVIFNRNLMLKKLLLIIERDQKVIATAGLADNLFQQKVTEDIQQMKRQLLEVEGKFYHESAAAALKQGNWYVADKNLRRVPEESHGSTQSFLSQKLKLLRSRSDMNSLRDKKASALQKLSEILAQLDLWREDQPELFAKPKDEVRFSLLRSKVYEVLLEYLSGDHAEEIFQILSKNADFSKHIGAAYLQNLETLKRSLRQKNHDCLLHASKAKLVVPQQGGGERRSKESVRVKEKAFLKLAKFCDQMLRAGEETPDFRKSMNLRDYPAIIVESFLETMQWGPRGVAGDYVPRLLQIIELYPETLGLFVEKSRNIPSKFFLKWVPQMVALLDKPESRGVYHILEKIADDYPEFLRYPLRISGEQFNFHDKLGQENEKKVDKLKAKLFSQAHDKFILGLKELTNPEHIFLDWLEFASVFLEKEENAKTPKEKEAIRKTITADYREMYNLVLEKSIKPEVRSRFAKEWAEVAKICGADGSLITIATMKKLFEYKEKVTQWGKKQPSPEELSKYSTWLASFQASDFDNPIEVPGADGWNDGTDHANIASFGKSLLVMSSLRKPKRLTVLGTDEKEHLFLVKGGEDLRLDQRIQQLFSVMNEIIKKAGFPGRKPLLRTYKVIPMTSSVGIIEWVSDTKPLKSVLEGEMAPEDRKAVQEKHAAWINAGGGYVDSYKKRDREETVRHLNDLFGLVRWDLLKTAIYKLSASPEAFLSIRSRFGESLASVNVCSYLLGIGDRHLDNFLVDLNSGQLVAIDFGHAFGSATQFLPYPELVPFRLTRQLVKFLSPHETGGLLENTMVRVMTCLQEHKDLVLNSMDVFLKEPLLDWQKFARRQAKSTKEKSLDVGVYATEKLSVARSKLERRNPSSITLRELELGHGTKEFFKDVKKVLMGTAEHNVRARRDNHPSCPTVRDQIECLIDQATDLNILGRSWQGLAPWM